MSLDNAQYPSELSINDPPFNDPVGQADDQIRTAKRVVFQGFPNISAPMTATQVELNYSIGVTSGIQGQINLKAPINAPVFTSSIGIGSAVVNESQLQILDGATVSTVELNYSVGVTSLIQDQLDIKLNKDGTKTVTGTTTFTDTTALATATSIGPVSSTEIGYLDGVTSPIQEQINAVESSTQDGVIGGFSAGTTAWTLIDTIAYSPYSGNPAVVATLEGTDATGLDYSAFIQVRAIDSNSAELWIKQAQSVGTWRTHWITSGTPA